MKRFEVFLKVLLKAVFRGYPYDAEKAKTSFEVIRNKNKLLGGANDNRK